MRSVQRFSEEKKKKVSSFSICSSDHRGVFWDDVYSSGAAKRRRTSRRIDGWRRLSDELGINMFVCGETWNIIYEDIKLKGALYSFRRERLTELYKTNWPERTTQFHTVLLCLYVAAPATCLTSNSVLGTLFSSEKSLFIQLWTKSMFLSLCCYLVVL